MYLPGPDQFTSRVKKLNNFLIFPKVHIPHEGMVGLFMDFQALIGAGIFSVALSKTTKFPTRVRAPIAATCGLPWACHVDYYVPPGS